MKINLWQNLKHNHRPRHFVLALSSGLTLFLLLLVFVSPAYSPLNFSVREGTKKIDPPAQLIEILDNKKNILADPKEKPLAKFKRSDALLDPDNRIHKEFKVPKSLKIRTSFWFDIYTKYDEHHHIIHHTYYPWVIFKVINTQPFMKGRGPQWLRRQRGLDYVERQRKKIQKTLVRLSKKTTYKHLNSLEKKLFKKLKYVRGSRKTVFSLASRNVRSQIGQKNFFMSGLKKSSEHLHAMEEIFAQYKLPTELTRLPFVESSFNEKAQSKVGASGIWQIMPQTGKHYAIVNKFIDERNSPLKASHISAKIFRRYFRALKSWPLAITAYNNGLGNIRKAMKRSNSRQLGKLIYRNKNKGAFKFASSNFYTSFLAALHAEKYHKEIFEEHNIQRDPKLFRHSFTLTKTMRPKTIAKLAGMKLEELVKHNLDIKKAAQKNIKLPQGFKILLPRKHHQIIINKLSLNSRKQASR